MLASAAAIYGVSASSAFAVAHVDLAGIRWSDEAEVRARLAAPAGANLFRVATEPLEARLRELPTVASASVTARLPGTLEVRVEERTPVLVWKVGERRYLVDGDGTLFAELPTRPGRDADTLPVVEDRRRVSARLGVGAALDPVDRDAATRLASLRAVDVGSAAAGLAIEVTDIHGFVVRARPSGWQAVFGFYTPSLRTPDMVPAQVRLLRSLLLEHGEGNVQQVILASETEGTFTTPPPSATP
ncbi:MAG TPA: FtsQ-type POTRA domain-containing protein [Vitreimonas sp.]|nr:FtsQ-type POTRA domain-containing protein [Vitreimonas sp.]